MYKNAEDFIKLANQEGIVQTILKKEYEYFEKDSISVYEELYKVLSVMEKSTRHAIEDPENYRGHIIGGDAKKVSDCMASYSGKWVMMAMSKALSASEVNASMGRICAAPTAGSCGIIPAALFTAKEQLGLSTNEMMDGLLVASLIGELITSNATVSGAEGGCQAECGSAAAMASGMLVYFRSGSIEQVFNAAAISLKNVMGLVCDPIAGLVEAPCAKRNASGVVNAMISADMSLAGVNSIVPFDEVVQAMYKVGKSLPRTLRETALGGIAVSKTGLEISKKIYD
ncbi:L-serine ammonia-lyase, iron-sulfur-dependent, subunit alpha [Acidaminobacter sp. JC074]|uniref:L-serine ammonia-lyase, iron-sulfur-dependent, subunit alpha n=1 Tax=Acidaminobacter sp. JC074 TaxID=2530199 RepID=UPI001F0D13EB|nr:L-serine ammonia-lyase, iron-sulfur-dependent, subunit alpha [Acidaminobacter sp. JC074]MCH4888150.1 L-serine ammonia-lyase, iron-sulfur-dependent, subunit alpha [Acidaminobacter sp. JC074]